MQRNTKRPDITLSEVRTRAYEVEREIMRLIDDFERATGERITDVSVGTAQMGDESSRVVRVIVHISL